MPTQTLEECALNQPLSIVPDATNLASGPGFSTEAGSASNLSNPKAALRRCCAAWKRAYDAHMAQPKASSLDKIFAERNAGEAYRNAMPMLAGCEGIRDFIVCAAHGILIGAIPREQSSQLLYAAQVALAAIRLESKPRK
jgi:hypothetical protein